ncbi:lysophospholipid acyltransferase family protein [Acidithiobacillus sp. IBUN Pt1247-S3]|uniref:lysophospholipid acyltransferase family protein n=1 Tax=Acidithiobacillus sp. IBUN Pt1247-S3 TaxID=3166642 RepID=UPI0034E4E452
MIFRRRRSTFSRHAQLIPYPSDRILRRSKPRFYRRFWRVPALSLHLAIAFPLSWWYYGRGREIDVHALGVFRWWCGVALRILGIRLRVAGPLPQAPMMLAANHVSYLDILALAAIQPGQFVAKKEMESWPLFGRLARRLGTFFIDRGDARASQRLLKDAAQVLREGRILTIFPEGTTSDGTDVGDFFAAPFETAVTAETMVVPVTLRYEDVLRPGHADRICPFIGEDTLAGHLWRLTASAPLTLRVHFGMPLSPQLGRRELAKETQRLIRESLRRMEEGAAITCLDPHRHRLRDAWEAWRRRGSSR